MIPEPVLPALLITLLEIHSTNLVSKPLTLITFKTVNLSLKITLLLICCFILTKKDHPQHIQKFY